LPCYCPQCLWQLCTYLLYCSRGSYFFQLFPRPELGLYPSFMLEFWQFVVSLHLFFKTLILLFLLKPWNACRIWFFIKSEEIFSKSPGILSPFTQEDMLIGLNMVLKPSPLVPTRLEVSGRTFRTFGCLSYPLSTSPSSSQVHHSKLSSSDLCSSQGKIWRTFKESQEPPPKYRR